MNSARFVAVAGVVLAGLVAGAGVRAGEAALESYTRPQPAEPPGPLRVITYYPETTTSTCIGDRRTPLCGLESRFASWVRSRDNGRDPLSAERLAFTRGYYILYKPIATRPLDEDDIPPWVQNYDRRKPLWRPGDTGIYLWKRTCSPIRCGGWNPSPMVHVMRQHSNGLWYDVAQFAVETIFDRVADGRADQRFAGPDEPPGPLRIVTTDYEISTSDCIKQPVTPLCAVETELARELHLRATGRQRYAYYNYKVMGIVRLDETNAPKWLLGYGPLDPPGYTGVLLSLQFCGTWGCDGWPSKPHMYVTWRGRRQPNRWFVF